MSDHYLTTAQLAERYQTSESTCRYWRATGYGPVGVKVGRRVLYPVANVEAFDRALAAQASANTEATQQLARHVGGPRRNTA